MFDIVSLGEILIDFTPCGVNAQGMALFARNPGGAPANVLAMNSILGGRSAFIGKVGSDAFGRYLARTLRDHAIDAAGLVVDAEIPTTLAFVQLDETGDRSFTFYRKPGADVRLTWDEVQTDVIDRCRIFHFGSVSLTDDPCRTAALQAAAYARAHGKCVSFDPNYRPALWTNEREARHWMMQAVVLADILKVSEEEMQLMTGETAPERGSLALLAMDPKIVFITMGEKGAYYRSAAGCGFCPAYAVDTIDTTGAGDAFTGAALWQLKALSPQELSQTALADITAFANAAGSLTTTRSGAIPALPSHEEIIQCLRSGAART